MTGTGNNTYLLIADRGDAALVDAGVGDARHLADLDAALSAHQATLTRVLVTHGHADHAGGAPAIRASHAGVTFAKRAWPGFDGHYDVEWRPLRDGDVVRAGDEPLVAIETPGHSPDHVVFWHEPSRTVFTGDLVVAGSSVMIHWSRGGNLADYMRSLERVLALEPRLLLPAHGPRVEHPRALLTGYLEHRRERERQVIEALSRGHADVKAIAESIYHGVDPALMPAARENVRAHLEKLKAEGRAREERDRWHV